MKNLTIKILQLLTLIMLFSCNSDDPDPITVDPTVLKGVFIDSPVQGLSYSTATQNGVTNSLGEFTYLEGEEVTFSIGNLNIGSATGASRITPVEISGSPTNGINAMEVQNRAALLQTLDEDRNPDNGITIRSEVYSFMPNTLDFSAPIQSTLAELVLQISQQSDLNLVVVYPNEAASHLATNIGGDYTPTDNTFEYLIRSMEGWHPIAQNSLVWSHTFDDQGRLATSEMWERYPYRMRRKHIYEEYNSDNMPIQYKQLQYDNIGDLIFNHTFYIAYNEDNRVSELLRKDENGIFVYHAKMLEWYENNKVYKSQDIAEDGTLGHIEVYENDEIGNTTRKIRYNSEGTEILRTVEYTYNENLDYATGTSQYRFPDFNADILDEYTYRPNGTLLKLVKTTNNLDTNQTTTQVINYDENEMPL